jgi:hexokinase
VFFNSFSLSLTYTNNTTDQARERERERGREMGKVAVGAAVVGAAAVCAAAALVVSYRMRSSGRWAKAIAILKEFEEKSGTPISKLRQVADAMTVEMHAGLASEGGSKLKMLISYVDNLPTG